MDHTGQENIWFVGCLTTARATPASREGVRCHYFHLPTRHFHLDIINFSVRLGKIKKAFHELHWLHCFNHYWPQLALMASQPTNLTLFVGVGLTQKTTLVNPFPTKL